MKENVFFSLSLKNAISVIFIQEKQRSRVKAGPVFQTARGQETGAAGRQQLQPRDANIREKQGRRQCGSQIWLRRAAEARYLKQNRLEMITSLLADACTPDATSVITAS